MKLQSNFLVWVLQDRTEEHFSSPLSLDFSAGS